MKSDAEIGQYLGSIAKRKKLRHVRIESLKQRKAARKNINRCEDGRFLIASELNEWYEAIDAIMKKRGY